MTILRGIGLFLVGVLVGSLGLYLWPSSTVVETAAPAQRQADGSLIAERNPDAPVKPRHEIPKGGKVERDIRVEVQPEGRPDCPVCIVDLSLVELPDATHRIVASSPTGQVLSALDMPRMPALLDRRKVWSVGALYNGRWGALAGRDLGWITVGGAITTEKDGGFAPWAMVVMQF